MNDKTPASPWGFMLTGVIVGLLGGLMLMDPEGGASGFLGVVLVSVGGIFAQIAVLSWGIENGMRRVRQRYDRG